MAAGSKVTDDKQEYQYSIPFVTPSGHQFTFYDTPDNQRLLIRHTSGSALEFKADGSIFITSVKDIHTHASILSSQTMADKGADNTTLRYDTDLTLNVAGKLKIKASSLDLEIGSTIRTTAGTDFILQGNNIIEKATESISLEGSKSVYLDTKEFRERVVSHKQETGSLEDGVKGGINYLRCHGNTVIVNDDENAGITIASRGYLNLVAGKERVDITGRYMEACAGEAISTWTQKVYAPAGGGENRSNSPGDIYFESQAGGYYNYATNTGSSSSDPASGLTELVTTGNRRRAVDLNEDVDIGGVYTRKASKIFLN